MELDDVLLAKLTIEPYLDQEFTRPAGIPWQALFNPTELSFSRKNTYNTTPSAGSSQPQTSYGGGEPDQVSLDLFFDGTGVVQSLQTVGERVTALLDLAAYQGDTHQPYYLHAHWGRFDFRGVLTQADVTYTLFDRTGEPLRAKVKITLQEAIAPAPLAAEEGNESPDLYQSWMVEEGQRLEQIAFAVYGGAEYWRPLAEANGLRNPRALTAGQTLILPALAADAR
jgi:contractile injection system tube protein